MDFNLSHMPVPVNKAEDCTLAQLPTADTEVKTDDLFKRKRVKGWWPAYEVDDEGNRLLNVSIPPSPSTPSLLTPHTSHVGENGAGI